MRQLLVAGTSRARRDALARRRRRRRRPSSSLGWLCQLLAVWAAMRAFHIHTPLVDRGPRARADQRRDDLPAVARQLRARPDRDRVRRSSTTASPYARGFAFGIGLQAIEASVGVGVGLIFLAREGLSYAMLKTIDEPERDAGQGARRGARACSLSRRPASLKGVLSPLEAAGAPRRRDAARRRASMRRAAGRRRRRGNRRRDSRGARRRRGERRVVSDALGRPVDRELADARRRHGGRRVGAGDRAATLVTATERDPLRATSAGLGELLLAVLATRVQPTLLVCVGGTATVDGGAGLRAVAGERLRDVPLRVLCDVRNPLLGERGAARVFGPQKGAERCGGRGARGAASPRSSRARRRTATCPARARAAGSAPGSRHSAATLVEGAELVLDTIGFDERARAAPPRRHRRGCGRRDDFRGQGAGRGRPPVRAARRALRALRRHRPGRARRTCAFGEAGARAAVISSSWGRS